MENKVIEENNSKNEFLKFEDFKKKEEDIKFYYTRNDHKRVYRNLYMQKIKQLLKFTVIYLIIVNIIVPLIGIFVDEHGYGYSYRLFVRGDIYSYLPWVWYIYTFFISLYIINYYYIAYSKSKYEKLLKEKIIKEYENSMLIINYTPDDIKYKIISLIESHKDKYDKAKFDLLEKAHAIEADGIVNLQHNTNVITNVSTTYLVGGGKEIETETKENHYLKGVAIKIL